MGRKDNPKWPKSYSRQTYPKPNTWTKELQEHPAKPYDKRLKAVIDKTFKLLPDADICAIPRTLVYQYTIDSKLTLKLKKDWNGISCDVRWNGCDDWKIYNDYDRARFGKVAYWFWPFRAIIVIVNTRLIAGGFRQVTSTFSQSNKIMTTFLSSILKEIICMYQPKGCGDSWNRRMPSRNLGYTQSTLTFPFLTTKEAK